MPTGIGRLICEHCPGNVNGRPVAVGLWLAVRLGPAECAEVGCKKAADGVAWPVTRAGKGPPTDHIRWS